MPFIHLHLHTIYSFLDGLVKPAELIEQCKKMGMKAVAITDHGNMHGVIDFYTAALGGAKTLAEAPVKPIIGMETYIASGDRTEHTKQDAYHLILLAKDAEGYRNLCYMASKAFIDGFYYKPRIDRSLLKEHAGGLIALSACLGGEIPKALMSGRYGDALNIAHEYQELFGKDNFFIELQVNGLREQEEVNVQLIKLAHEIGAGLVATNDVHYLKPDHAEAQDILFCINEKKKVHDTDRMHHETDAFYLKTEEEMRRLFAVYGPDGENAIENTWKIAQSCNVELILNRHYLPDFETFGKSESEYLREISLAGLEERFVQLKTPEDKKKEYYDRLDYEIAMIAKTGFAGYFLIVADFINWAKDNNIPVGPGRGSGAGSLVAYSTKITDLDPLRFGLFFERFLNPERVSMPDFDVDFCQDNRDRVINYVSGKYGEKNVAQIATFGQLKAKSAIKDVARALDIPLATAEKLAKLVPDSFVDVFNPQFSKKHKETAKKLAAAHQIPSDIMSDPDRLKDFLEKIRLKEDESEMAKSLISDIETYANERILIKNNKDFSRIIKIAVQIEGLLRQPGKHACGVVIGQKPIFEYSPIFVDKDNYRITQYDKNMVELVGLVKFDFLGLKTLTMINNAVNLIRRKKPDFDISKIPFDDAPTYRFLCEKSTKGVFQMESAGFEKMIHQMKPDRIEDLIAAVALYRPGPMDIIPNYIKRKHGREEIEYDHPWLEDILRETNGLIVYQEQVMQISQKMAGFTLGKADILRRAMGKKKAEEMQKMKSEFITGASTLGVSKDVAGRVFDHMEKFASYGFNKSHAACYGYISYQTAYLKTHYPVEFIAALISSEAGSSDKVFSYISDARQLGINVYPPDVNRSEYSFSIEKNSIRFGMGAIKNVGEGAIEEIISEREKNGEYKSLIDFTSRINQSKVNSRTVEFLIKAGAFDFTGINRGLLLSMLPYAIKEGEKAAADKESGQISLFDAFNMSSSSKNEPGSDENILKMVENPVSLDVFDSLALEREVLGIYISNHPVKYFVKDFRNLGLENIKELIENAENERRQPGRNSAVWIGGMITTEIKPAKGRDGDYYLKGVIESSDAAIEFSINRIENPLAQIGRLESKVPLMFRVKVRAVRNREDNTLEKVMLNIDSIEDDIKTIPEYIQHNSSGSARMKLVLEMDESEFIKRKGDIARKITAVPLTGIPLPLELKLFFNGGKSSAVLEKTGIVDISALSGYKELFGSENIYLSR